MEWIQSALPKLELSLSNGYSWRSKLVFVYHAVQGRFQAELYATESWDEMWWVLRGDATWIRTPMEDILGWLPIDTLPDRPAAKPVWAKVEAE